MNLVDSSKKASEYRSLFGEPKFVYAEYSKQFGWQDYNMHWEKLSDYIEHARQRSEDKCDVRGVFHAENFFSDIEVEKPIAICVNGVVCHSQQAMQQESEAGNE